MVRDESRSAVACRRGYARAWLLAALLAAMPGPAHAQGATRHVLLLYSSERAFGPQSSFAEALKPDLICVSRGAIDFVEMTSQAVAAVIPGQTPTVWQVYRDYIIAIAVVVAAELALIAALLAQRSRRRRAEKVIKARESALLTSYSQIRRLAARLLQAQDEARSTLARDLHDDFCQKLALVGIGISSLKQSRGSVQDPANQHALSELEERTQELFDDVRRLSHDLHPTSLRVLGLGPALSAYIVEMERTQGVRITYQGSGDLTRLDPEVSVCLFRIAQEAVRNGVTHGRARQFTVTVTRAENQVEMVVTDDGQGFDLDAVRERGGLGLVSMEERAHAVGGTIEIVTAVGRGTTVRVRCPIEGQERARAS